MDTRERLEKEGTLACLKILAVMEGLDVDLETCSNTDILDAMKKDMVFTRPPSRLTAISKAIKA